MSHRGSIVLGVVLAAAPVSSAWAIDGARVRTPVVWPASACMTIVDRSANAVVEFEYDVPFEDTERTDDEVADGRTHQFFALCRDPDLEDALPGWISEADVAAAEAVGLIDPGVVIGAAILDLDPDWQGCAVRITPDADRHPITFEAAASGFAWDTSDVEAGAWVVEGLTHDPAYNIWSSRPGVVKVVDDPAPEASGPALAVLNGETLLPSGEPLAIEGCVSAMPGTELELEWARVGEAQWNAASPSEPIDGDTFSLTLQLPTDVNGLAARVRVRATDPQGRTSIAYMPGLVLPLPEPGSPCEDDDSCETSGTGEDPDAGSTGDAPDPNAGTTTSGGEDASDGSDSLPDDPTATSGADAPAQDEGSAGGCRTQSPSPLAAAWVLLLISCTRRRG